ncbi:hypothetical protein HDE_11342 [Halotydeus destructor]|nr:hypothetical protein HDE_11342 [Halotydeus destructor]
MPLSRMTDILCAHWPNLLRHHQVTLASEELKEPAKVDGIQPKNDQDDDDDLLKAESQDVEHKQLYQLHQGHFPGHEGQLGIQLPLHLSRPGQIGLPSLNKAGQQGPQFGPQPVYPGVNMNAAPSNVIENAVEYGSESAGHQVPPQHNHHQGQHHYNHGPQKHNLPQGSAPGPAIQPPQQSPYQVNSGQGQVVPQAQNPSTAVQGGNDVWPLATPDTPKIVHLDVKCEKNLMKVAVEFDKPFNGIIFSKGHYSQQSCVHLAPGSGKSSVTFDISIGACGTTGNTQNGLYGYGATSGSGTFFENTIVIQYDPQVQEVWDQARKLRCTWHDQYEKSVTFRPFPVDMLDVVRADFAGDNVGCWMQIQVGKGPWASEVAGIAKIGQTMTIVLAIKDEENKFDMLVRNCIAHDGKRAPIELVDSSGCIVRPKLMSKFTKIKNFGSSASVLSYAHFQAFKFPDSMEVHFQCTIQICRYQCPEQCSQSQQPGQVEHVQPDSFQGHSSNIVYSLMKPREERRKRDIGVSHLAYQMDEIGMNKVIQVVSSGDLAFTLGANQSEQAVEEQFSAEAQRMEISDTICMSTSTFTGASLILTALLVSTCLVAVFACHRSSKARR